uniref:Sema domain-containing protein n=1 Tax=Salarias fasciatus TaxID=181472 RepID=A0A672J7R6_SALFA
ENMCRNGMLEASMVFQGFAVYSIPRRTVPFNHVKSKRFQESDASGLSSLLLRDDIGQLVVGARGKILTLRSDDISKKTGEVQWTASPADKAQCQMKGKKSEDCHNFIKVLHSMNGGRMLACGTNAFSPSCDYLTIANGKVSLLGKELSGKGKVPFDPNQRFASLMDKSTLFSATTSNFLSTDVVFQKHGAIPVRTEMKRSWLNEPTMISINLLEASKYSDNGEDDQVFLFMTENAVEDWRGNLPVSRIARVCKSDLGGRRTLQQRWTSFVKARLDCPFGDAGSSALVQDVFLLQNQSNWKESIFYATFTSNPQHSGAVSHSAVCAYRLSDISTVLSGRFLTETETGSWVRFTGDEPSPRPGSCINDEARAAGRRTSLNLSNQHLMFARNHSLMEGVVTPITGKPLLVQSSTKFTKIVIDQVSAPDGQRHQMMLIGTESGSLLKAVKPQDEEGRVIEELQLFEDPLPVQFIELSQTGQLYSGTRNALAQIDARDCGRYLSCDDCILARDPYCGWDQIRGNCAPAAGASSWFQSLRDGDPSMCPPSLPTKLPEAVVLTINSAHFLPCRPDTNLPTSWRFSENILNPGPRHTPISQGLITIPSATDAGLYTCETVENIRGKMHRRRVIQYLVQVQDPSINARKLKAAGIALIVFLVFLLIGLCLLFIHRKWKKRNSEISSV